jgi:hypothetical protein
MATKFTEYGIDAAGKIHTLNSTDQIWVENTELACVHGRDEANVIAAAIASVDEVEMPILHRLADHVRNGGIKTIQKAVEFLQPN